MLKKKKNHNMKLPKILAILPGFIPSTLIGVVKPLLSLHLKGFIKAKITLEVFAKQEDLEKADLVVFCRNAEPRYFTLLNYLATHNIPFIYDLDDNFFEIPFDSPIGQYYQSAECHATLVEYIKSARLVRVYSNPLYEKVKTLNPKVEKISGPIDEKLIFAPLNNLNHKIKIVYATSRIQDKLNDLLTDALIRILKEFSEQVEVHFWGPNSSALQLLPGFIHHPVIRNYDHFLKKFSQNGFDIGLAPLVDDIFHRSKSNNKFREYGACRIAGIYSDVEVYSNCVIEGKTGLLVPNDSDSWYQALVRLIEDRDLREKIKSRASEFVLRHYSQENFEKCWLFQIQELLANPNNLLNSKLAESEFPEPAIAIDSKYRMLFNKVKRFWGKGGETMFKLLLWRLFDLWMIFKIDIRLKMFTFHNFIKGGFHLK